MPPGVLTARLDGGCKARVRSMARGCATQWPNEVTSTYVTTELPGSFDRCNRCTSQRWADFFGRVRE
jgi:hypothetical protein